MKVTIANFKGIGDETTIDFDSNFNILVGKNNGGKTSILQAIWLAEDPFALYFDKSRLEEVSNVFGLPLYSRIFYNKNKEIQINDMQIKFYDNPQRVEISTNNKIYGIASILRLESSAILTPLLPYEKVIEDKNELVSVRIKKLSKYKLQVREIWNPKMSKGQSVAYLSPLFKDKIHKNLGKIWGNIYTIKVIDFINNIENIDEITYETDEEGISEIFLIKNHRRIPLSIYGDGFQSAVISLLYLSYIDAKTILFDDIEAFMNPQLIEEYLLTLNKYLKSKKVIIVTHSYDVLRTLKDLDVDGKIFVCNLAEGKFESKTMDIKDLDESIKFDVRYPTTFNIM